MAKSTQYVAQNTKFHDLFQIDFFKRVKGVYTSLIFPFDTKLLHLRIFREN